jgi:methyl-accepting chemotaxis protein PixJ
LLYYPLPDRASSFLLPIRENLDLIQKTFFCLVFYYIMKSSSKKTADTKENKASSPKLVKKLDLRSKIVMGAAAIGLLPVLIAGGVLYHFADDYATPITEAALSHPDIDNVDKSTIIKNTIIETQQKLTQAIIWVSLLIAVVAAISASLLANRNIRPLLQLLESIGTLERGKLENRLPTSNNGQLSVLETQIDRVATNIQNLTQQQKNYSDRLLSQNEVFKSLARNESFLAGDVLGTARAFSEAIAKNIRASRVSIWLFSQRRDAIECFDLYELQSDRHKTNDSLLFKDNHEYFQFLLQDRPLIEEDALTAPAMAELRENYLIPAGIVSKLDVPIQSGGMVAGVICCEQTDNRRLWKAEDSLFVGSIANLMALAIESEQLQKDIAGLLNVVSELEDGNLLARAAVSDRTTGLIADTLNRLLEKLGSILAQVSQTTNLVFYVSGDLGVTTEQLANNAQEQTKEATSVLRLVKQVKAQITKSADRLNTANRSLVAVNSTVESGQDALIQMNQGIEVLREGTNQIIQQMKTLGEFVGLADQFVQEQGQIASLTQVLALNATLVAARASEQKDPMQFAVVAREFEAIASEVSTLAQQTNEGLATLQQRTEQINNVVTYVDGQIQNLGGLVNGFTIGVEQSNQIYNKIDRVTKEVVQSTETIALSNQSIVNASELTNIAMKEIVTLAVRNAKMTQRVKRESSTMEDLSDKLLKKVGFFRLGDVSLSETSNFVADLDFETEQMSDLIPVDELTQESESQTLLFAE